MQQIVNQKMKSWKTFKTLNPNLNLKVFLRRRNIKNLLESQILFQQLGFEIDNTEIEQILGLTSPFVVFENENQSKESINLEENSELNDLKIDLKKRIYKNKGNDEQKES